MVAAVGAKLSNKKSLRKIFLIGLIGLLLNACNYSRMKGLGSEDDLGDLSACGPIDYATINTKIFSLRCVACHGPELAEKGILLDSYEAVSRNIESVGFQVHNNKMPRGKPLSQSDKKFVMAWIAQGFPEHTSEPSAQSCAVTETTPAPAVPPPVTDPVEPPPPPVIPPVGTPCEDLIDFKTVNEKILEPICLNCHGLLTDPPLDSYADVRKHLLKLGGLVRLDKMPPKKPLDSQLKELLFKWIDNGSPEVVDKTSCAPSVN